jgi:hypothetical protein
MVCELTLLPTNVVPRADDRRVLKAILWRLRTGAPQVDTPSHCDPHTNPREPLYPLAETEYGRGYSRPCQMLVMVIFR